MANMFINYYQKDVYGKNINYVIDPSEKLQGQIYQLTGNKTLTDSALKILRSWGVVFNRVLEPEK